MTGLCGCECATRCPLGRVGSERQCIVVELRDELNQLKIRGCMQREELERRCLAVVFGCSNGHAYTVQERVMALADLLSDLTQHRKIHVGGAIEVNGPPVAFCSEPFPETH